jgi:SnoaL-like protein
MSTALPPVIAEHLAAVNAFDEERVVATFAEDALVNDVQREFRGVEAIRKWVAKEIVGDHVTIDVIETTQHHRTTVVRGRYDGDYDKTNLPDELILTNYFELESDKIVSLIIIHNGPSPY